MRDFRTAKSKMLRKKSTDKRAGMVGFAVITMLLVILIAGLCAETVKCRNDVSVQEMELFYAEKEQELVGEIKALLKEEGYENSGVMLTRVVDVDGSRQYKITIHHGRINALSSGDRQELLEKLKGLFFEGEQISFCHEFLAGR